MELDFNYAYIYKGLVLGNSIYFTLGMIVKG